MPRDEILQRAADDMGINVDRQRCPMNGDTPMTHAEIEMDLTKLIQSAKDPPLIREAL